VQQVLEDADLKVAGVATDIMGVSGRAMLAAIVAGTTDSVTLANLARGKLRSKREQLEHALSGRVGAHHRLLLGMHLAHIDFLDELVAQLNAENYRATKTVQRRVELPRCHPWCGPSDRGSTPG
jgi:hypothetical protein